MTRSVGPLPQLVRGIAIVLALVACGKDGRSGDGGVIRDDRPRPPPSDIGLPRAVQGHFTEVALSPDGPARYAVVSDFHFGEPETTAGIFLDLDGDGSDELVDMPEFLPYGARDRRASVFRLVGGEWHLDAAATDRLGWRIFAAADLDGDGFNDLVGDDRKLKLAVAWGSAQGADAAEALEFLSPGPEMGRVVSIFLDDLDHDGWLDLLVGNFDCTSMAGPLRAWLYEGARRFVEHGEMIPAALRVKPYVVGTAHPRAGESIWLTLGSPCSLEERAPSFFRESGVDAEGRPRMEVFNPLPDDPDFKAGHVNPNLAYFAPMGAAWGDLDGDGRFDALITLDPMHTTFRGLDSWPMQEVSNETGFSRLIGLEARPLLPWSVLILDLDGDGRPEVLHSHGNDLGGWREPRFSSAQWVTIHQNRGAVRFLEMSGALGMQARQGQWRSLVAGDPDRDGDADLLLGGAAEHPRLFRNDISHPDRGTLSLRLEGTTSNRWAIGARVDVPAHDDVVAQHFLVGSTMVPTAVMEPWVFVTTSAARTVPEVRVTWPSGLTQVVRDLAAGRSHRIVEPRLVAVTPAARHLPAGEGSAFTLRVTPRREDGTADPDAPVEASLLRGSQRVALPAQRQDDGWSVTVPGSREPGSARVEVRIAGRALGVSPRVWWDAP